MKTSGVEWLRKPRVVLVAVILGVILGCTKVTWIDYFKPVGSAYLFYLQMISTVMMPAAIISGIGRAVKSNSSGNTLSRMTVVFLLLILTVASFSVLIGIFSFNLKGNLQSDRIAIGKMVLKNDMAKEKEADKVSKDKPQSEDKKMTNVKYINSNKNDTVKKTEGFQEIIFKFIPSNIFSSLVSGETLKIVFFSILFGIMLKYVPVAPSDSLLEVSEGLFESMESLLKFSNYFMPLGIFALVTVQVKNMSAEVFKSLAGLLVVIYIGCGFVAIFSAIVVKMYTKKPILKAAYGLKNALIMGITTKNSLAVLPTAIEDVQTSFGMDKNSASLSLSVSLSVCRNGVLMIFGITSVYMMYVFDIKMTVVQLLGIVALCAVASVSTAGVPSILGFGMISIVLSSLGIPFDIAVVLLMLLEPIMIPVTTAFNVFTSCMAAAIINFARD